MYAKYFNSWQKLTLNSRYVAHFHPSTYSGKCEGLQVPRCLEKSIKSHKTRLFQENTQRYGFKPNALQSISNKSLFCSSHGSDILSSFACVSSLTNKKSVDISNLRFFSSTNTIPQNVDEGKVRKHKIFPELENSRLYQIILSIPELEGTLAPSFKTVAKEDVISDDEFKMLMTTDFSKVNKFETLEAFKKVTYYMHDKEDSLAHTSFNNLCNALVVSIQDLSDDDLCKLLFLLQVWSPKCFRTDHNFFQIFSAIDKAQVGRMSNRETEGYDNNQMLHILGFWSQTDLLKSSNFCKLALRKLANKCHQLDPKYFVLTMFYQCRYRSFHPLVNSYDVEFVFEKIYDELSPSEIAIVLLAFFKSEKPFHSPHLCVKIAKTFINHAEQLDSICVNAYLKSLKFHFPFKDWNVLYQVCGKLCQILETKDPLVLAHAAVVGTKINVYHPELLDKIVEVAIKHVGILRIKDLEKILYPIVIFSHKLKQPEILDAITQEFTSEKRQKEIEQHPKTLISLVHHLILSQHFNSELIGKCLDIDFLEKCFGKRLTGYVLPKDLLLIDFSTEIEFPSYTGPKLPEDLRHKLCKHYAWRKPGELFHNKEIIADELGLTVQKKLAQMLGGEKFTHVAYVLPHFIKPDLLICLDNGKPVPIPESMSDFVYMSAYPPPATGKWFAFVFLTFTQVVNQEKNVYKGPNMCKLRQLKLLGYEPIVISTYEWKNETEEAREQILKNKLGQYLESNDNNSVSVKNAS